MADASTRPAIKDLHEEDMVGDVSCASEKLLNTYFSMLFLVILYSYYCQEK